MNRFKKELAKRGYKMEQDFEYMPYETSPGIYLEGIEVNAEACTYTKHYSVLSISVVFDKYMHEYDAEDGVPMYKSIFGLEVVEHYKDGRVQRWIFDTVNDAIEYYYCGKRPSHS
jgi:hypothetical protein